MVRQLSRQKISQTEVRQRFLTLGQFSAYKKKQVLVGLEPLTIEIVDRYVSFLPDGLIKTYFLIWTKNETIDSVKLVATRKKML